DLATLHHPDADRVAGPALVADGGFAGVPLVPAHRAYEPSLLIARACHRDLTSATTPTGGSAPPAWCPRCPRTPDRVPPASCRAAPGTASAPPGCACPTS